MRIERVEGLIFPNNEDSFMMDVGAVVPAQDPTQTAYLRGVINMSLDRVLVKRSSYNLFDIIAAFGGYAVGVYFILWGLLYLVLNLYSRLKVVSSVFHLSVVQEAKFQRQPINI